MMRFPIARSGVTWHHEEPELVENSAVACPDPQEEDKPMVERRVELNRRYSRKKKMQKLKARLASAKDNREREQILRKIHALSPWWKEPATAKK
jgi:hypothetical protein